MARRRKQRSPNRRQRLDSLYKHKPWTNGGCINPLCGSSMVAKCCGSYLRDKTRADTLFCHDCGLELPEDVWRKYKKSIPHTQELTQEERIKTQKDLRRLSKKLIFGPRGNESVALYRVAHGMETLSKARGPARRVRIVPEGEGQMAKKKGKKAKKVKVEKESKRSFSKPTVGTVLRGTYKGKTYTGKVTRDGIRIAGKKKLYTSTSDAAQGITGRPTSGPTFFGLRNKNGDPTGAKKSKKATKKGKKAKKARRERA